MHKALAAFLNTGGGVLFIGIDDDGTVVGLGADFKAGGAKSPEDGRDRLLRAIVDGSANALGVKWSNLPIESRWFEYEGQWVLGLRCGRADAPTFVDDKFFCREENRSMPLTGRDQAEFIRKRFSTWMPGE